MGNAFCYSCSPCQEQMEISADIMRAVEGMQSMQEVDELIDYIDRLLSIIGSGGQEQISRPASMVSFINSGGDLIEKLSKRLKWHVCKKCFFCALERQTRNIVIDVLKEAQHIPFLGMSLSIMGYLMERAEQTSSNKVECLRLLGYMSGLVKHMKNLDILVDRAKLDAILLFIVQGTLMCARQMKPQSSCRFIFASLDAADLENLKSQLLFLYPDLALQAVTEVLNRLPIVTGPSQGEYPPDAVGIEESQKQVIDLLDLTEASPRVVVIYGVGGIGKTTLATAVFRTVDLTGYHYCRVEMDHYCRLSDLLTIQKQILRNLFNQNLKLDNCTHGREKLREAIEKASQPVFLFIDNALKHTDVEMLLPMEHLSGLPILSRILVTTRSLDSTKIFEQHGIQVHPHRTDSLPQEEAKRVLCHYALGDKNSSFDPSVDMDGLLRICEGIPLVLKIVGSKLRSDGNSVSACNQILEYVKEWQRTGLEGGDEDLSERMVDFVYRRLTKPSQEAFLDIAFFFHEWERSKVCDIVGEMQLRDLEGAALVTAYEKEEYEYSCTRTVTKMKVHDIVRARGRKLSEGNRITDWETFSILLTDPQKLQQTKGIWLDKSYYYSPCETKLDELSVEAEHLDLMSISLRVLGLGRGIKVNGVCERAFKDLRFLDIWYEDVLPLDLSQSRQLVGFHGHLMEGHRLRELPESLRLLYLEARPLISRVSELEADERNSGVLLDISGRLTSLRDVQLSNITLANFENSMSQLKSLRSLQLKQFGGFTWIRESVGLFSCLKLLTLCNCSTLERLPESFGDLSSLQYLNMNDCCMLERLPESFGDLSSLETLAMIRCSILEKLPESFGNLSSMLQLQMSECFKLERLPESFGDLSSLQTLVMFRCTILEKLPESFGNLSSLHYLSIGNLTLESLPESFGNISSLQKLYIHECYELERLPESLGNLSSLQSLEISCCCMLEIPESFGNLSSLRDLSMAGCVKLERLSESFGNLSSLHYLNMQHCKMLQRLPQSFGTLSCLEILNMNKCSRLERLPEIFGNLSSLQKLHINNCSRLERLPESLGNLSSLHYLDMQHCSMLHRLPQSFGTLSCLEILNMNNCSRLERLPENFGNLSSLQKLQINNCPRLERLPKSFGNLSFLQILDISYCSNIERLPDSLGNLSSLQIFRMHNFSNLERLPQTFDKLSCLETLEVDGCEKLCSLFYNFGQLKGLKFLSISNCIELKRLPDDIECSTSLTAVKAYGCAELEAKAMDKLTEIKNLIFLEMGESPMLIKRWEEIQQHRPLIGAALRFEQEKYPYEEIMSTMFFSGGSRFLHLDGEGQLVEEASFSFPEVGVKVGLLLTACDLSNQVRQKLVEVASPGIQMIYVDVGVEGSSWMEEREQRIRKTLLRLPEGSRAWTSRFSKTTLLFAYSLWRLTLAPVEIGITTYHMSTVSVGTSMVGTSVVEDGEGRRQLSHPLDVIFRRRDDDRRGEDLRRLFSPLHQASEWMVGKIFVDRFFG